MTKIKDATLLRVSTQIEKILIKEKMALQPYMNRNIQGTFAAVRLVSTEVEEEAPLTINEIEKNANERNNPKKADSTGDSDTATSTK